MTVLPLSDSLGAGWGRDALSLLWWPSGLCRCLGVGGGVVVAASCEEGSVGPGGRPEVSPRKGFPESIL